ncbi:MAG TPA: M67 family metallopeptidase [Geobacteraceae bacterium]|nr:M67 family metallopeptidase [Geobacteraceae bacterium]
MLHIPRKLAETIIDLAYEGLPMKVCGILGGTGGVVSSIFPVNNISGISEHFTMDPVQQFKIIKEMQDKGLEMIGVYHSHLENPAYPTADDVRMALSPDLSLVIISLKKLDNPVLKSFRISPGHVEPEQVEYL